MRPEHSSRTGVNVLDSETPSLVAHQRPCVSHLLKSHPSTAHHCPPLTTGLYITMLPKNTASDKRTPWVPYCRGSKQGQNRDRELHCRWVKLTCQCRASSAETSTKCATSATCSAGLADTFQTRSGVLEARALHQTRSHLHIHTHLPCLLACCPSFSWAAWF